MRGCPGQGPSAGNPLGEDTEWKDANEHMPELGSKVPGCLCLRMLQFETQMLPH